MSALFRFSLLSLALIFACNFSTHSSQEAEGKWYKVVKVVDGDTFHAQDSAGNVIKVRLIGIDAPESRKTPKEDVQYYGKEAKAFLTGLISGHNVRLEYDVGKKDRYGRTLAYVYMKNGAFINAELVRQGYAAAYTVPPNVRHADTFQQLQREAKEAKRGLWKE